MSEERKKEILSYIRQRHDISDRVSDERLAEIWNLEILFTLEFLSSRTPDLALLREAFEAGENNIDRFGDCYVSTDIAFKEWLKDKGLAEG